MVDTGHLVTAVCFQITAILATHTPAQKPRTMRRRLLLHAFTVAAFFLFVACKVPRSVHHGTSAAATTAYWELYERTLHNESDSRLSLETFIWMKNWKRLMNCTVNLYQRGTERIPKQSCWEVPCKQSSLTSLSRLHLCTFHIDTEEQQRG